MCNPAGYTLKPVENSCAIMVRLRKIKRKMEGNLLKKSGKKVILLGNEAIVRGALEAGVQFVSAYPGTPSSEIGNNFYLLNKGKEKIAKNFYFEFSTNEKVALEAGMGASFSGLKTLVAMKHFGLNVCQDALLPFVYSGCVGPTVIVVSDDPNCYSSAQSEQNSRFISQMGHIPTLEPGDPQEAKDFTKLGFAISAKFRIPVIIRTTTRVAHQRALVMLDNLPLSHGPIGKFIKDKKKFVTMPPRVLEMKQELLGKIEKIRELAESSPANKIYRGSSSTDSNKRLGIITSGVSYLYVLEALKELGISAPILKLGFFYPLPKKKIKSFLKDKKKVLIVEELEGILEKEASVLAKDVNPKLEILGKDLLPQVGELRPEMVVAAIAKLTDKKYHSSSPVFQFSIPKRFPQPCAGCPYWLAFGALKQAVDPKKVIWGGDIGCYMLAGTPSVDIQDYLYCMGSSIGIAHGIKKVSRQKLIAFIGDSTFFHAGIPALINAVANESNPLIIIMDNSITAMTGQQPNPGRKVKIEEIIKACGVKHLKIVDPLQQKEFIETVKDFVNKKEVAVIISRRPCLRI